MSTTNTGDNELYIEQRWIALTRRNGTAAAPFVYGVLTTGVYCLPGCPSRLPTRENVRFFDNWTEAEQAGFRPCKRCRPSSPDNRDSRVEAVVAACRALEDAEKPASLREMAAVAGLSPFHFHRLFKSVVGITPGQYARERRMARMRDQLREDVTVTEAIYQAGFSSGSRFYEKAEGSLGMKPSQYRKGGQNMVIRFATVSSHLGWVLVAATDKGICAIDIGDEKDTLRERLRARFPKADLVENDSDFAELVSRVTALLESPRTGHDLPLDIRGTAFQQRVWAALRDIPAGSTTTYKDIAARIGEPKAVRAVATAIASNNIAVAIPCHRVVRSDGNLAGYRWGIERKRKLLELEATDPVAEKS